LIIWLSIASYGQSDVQNEILVYFSTGVTQVIFMHAGKEEKAPMITSVDLKEKLANIGIVEKMIEVALPSFSKPDTLKILSDGTRLEQLDMSKLYKIIVPNQKERDTILSKLRLLPQVLYADPNGLVSPQVTIPDDEDFDLQWGLRNEAQLGIDINAIAAWDIYTGNQNNIIAIIDWGVDFSHEDLDAKVAGGDTGYDTLSHHGVHVAGIAAAETNNNEGIAGVDWNARIHSQRLDIATGDQHVYQSIIDAVNYNNNVKVLNNSWGLIDGYDEFNRPIAGRYSTTVALAFAYAYKANRVLVAAMGNHEEYMPGVISYPSGLDNVISVGSINRFGEIADDSGTGEHIDLCAPGVEIRSTIGNNGYWVMSGTSMATPHVSGTASLLSGFNQNLSNDDIANIIRLSAADVDYPNDNQIGPGFDVKSGYGLVNAKNALDLLSAPNTLKQWTATGGTTHYRTGLYQVNLWGVQGLMPGEYLVKRHEVRKTVVFPEQFCTVIGGWGRGVSTTGFGERPTYGMGFCDIVPNTLTTTGATLRTYIYEVYTMGASFIGFYPQVPTQAAFAYSILGVPNIASTAGPITGPNIICSPGVFSVQNMPPGCSITWNPGPYLTMSSQQGSNPCTFTANGSGASWVEATITDSLCGSTTLPKSYVQVNPSYSFILTEYDQDCNTVTLTTNLPSYTSVTWNASSNFLIDGYSPPLSKQGNSIIVTSTDGNGGSVYGTTSLGCSVTPFTTFCPCQSWSGASITWIWACPSPGEPLIAEVSPLHPDATEYKWYIGDQLIETTYDGYLQTYNWPCTSEMPHLYVTGVTSCGHTELIDGGEFFPACGGNKSSSNVILYPNPASSVVTITLEENQSPVNLISREIQINTLSEITQVKLIDKTGMTRKLMNFGKSTTKVSLQLSEFQSGVYYLNVADGDRHVIKPLIIKK